jgi:type VI protein secretion system component Hcp
MDFPGSIYGSLAINSFPNFMSSAYIRYLTSGEPIMNAISKSFWLPLALILGFIWTEVANAEVFISIPGIIGSSTVDGYKGWISSPTMATEFAKGTCKGVAAYKSLDQASPQIAAAVLTGQLFNEISIAVTSLDKNKYSAYLLISLQNAEISEVSISGNAVDGRPSETFIMKARTIIIKTLKSDTGSSPTVILNCSEV